LSKPQEMKKVFTLLLILCTAIFLHAQTCTTTGFDKCTAGSGLTSNFRNAVQINNTGNPLTIGAKYKFSNALPNLNLDAIISIDTIVNATMADADGASFDNDNAADESGTAGTQAALFAPRIAPDQILSCTDRTGYVEFTIKFYTHFTGNNMPVSGSEIAISNLNFLTFDIDGMIAGNDGWLKKTSYVRTNDGNPLNFSSPSSELTAGGVKDGWILTYGSTAQRSNLSSCENVIEKTMYPDPRASISFRMGYDYKAPSNCSGISMKPTMQNGSKFSCYTLPAAAPLQVSLIDLAGYNNNNKITITWTCLQEQNLNSYEIQRSYDGTVFEVAGNIKANNLTAVQQYKFIDNALTFTVKNIYYRVRIIDNGHSQKLTNAIVVKMESPKSNEMSISPNPSSSAANIKVIVTKATKGDITVFDASGKVILKQQASLVSGNNTITLKDVTALSEGYYTVRLVANDEIFTSKLLVWK